MSFADLNNVQDPEEAQITRYGVMKSLANFFNSMGLYSTAAQVLVTVLKHQRMSEGIEWTHTHEYAHDVKNLGQMYFTAGKYKEAQAFINQAKSILAGSVEVCVISNQILKH